MRPRSPGEFLRNPWLSAHKPRRAVALTKLHNASCIVQLGIRPPDSDLMRWCTEFSAKGTKQIGGHGTLVMPNVTEPWEGCMP